MKSTKTSKKSPLKAPSMPQSKTKAAAEAHMYLYTDDHWSKAYFDRNDLHCLERELFS